MHRTKLVRGLFVAALAVSMLAPTTAYAATARIYVNKGVKSARLGMYDTAAARRIGRVVLKKRDRSYAGRVVWVRYFGTKRNGKYALELYSNKSRKVFAFVINRNTYATAKGIRVGSSEAALTAAYGTLLTANPGPVYNRYVLGGRSGTDFYVRGGVVTKIVVRRF
ncbi:MAG: hypothetical protein Q7W16_02380 [Coriobacteriia bacterium]|nr:hypothetical protein [Coriobacteriia bacterium]